MTIAIKHAFISLKGDGTDATQVQPSNWNSSHSFQLASGNLVGRLTAGAGDAEEIPISAYMANLLQAADAATLAGLLGLFITGDVKYTFSTTAPAGWVLINQAGANTIGSAASSATVRANNDCLALYQLIYAACNDTIAPVIGGRSGNSLTDFNANKPLTIPNLIGKSPIGAGAAAGFTTRVLGAILGEETHLLTIGEMPAHTHANSLTDPGHSHSVGGATQSGLNAASFQAANGLTNPGSTSSATTGITINNASQGGGAVHNNMHPVVALNPMVKL